MDTLVSQVVAILAKEKGFDQPCFYYYHKEKLQSPYLENGSSTDTDFRVDLDDLLEDHNYKYLLGTYYSAPTQAQLQKWLREVHNINVNVFRQPGCWEYMISRIEPYCAILDCTTKFYTYEEALEQGLLEALRSWIGTPFIETE